MHDLRKKALLESSKTVSRKARSRPESARGSATHSPRTSPGHSRPNSRPSSRPGSRYASEDEDGFSDAEIDDTMTMSTVSGSEDGVEGDASEPWVDRLHARISELEDRKRSSVQGRSDSLKAFLHLICHHYSKVHIGGSTDDVVSALLKSIKSGGSADERALALRSLTVVTLTCASEDIFEDVYTTLNTVCEDAEDETVKSEAIYAMVMAVLYGGGSTVAAEELLQFLLEIVASDGHTVNAADNATVVVAALQAWGFVASHLDDLSEYSEDSMEAFIEQLDSTDAEVQTGAGSNIALLFEVAREYEEENGETLNLPYDPKRLIKRMNELARGSKSISKRDRRLIRTNFASVATSLELGKGPRYSTARRPDGNPHTGGSGVEDGGSIEFGYRERVRIHGRAMVIDTWSLMIRVETLKRILAGGFPTHFTENPTVSEILNSGEVEDYGDARAKRSRGYKSP